MKLLKGIIFLFSASLILTSCGNKNNPSIEPPEPDKPDVPKASLSFKDESLNLKEGESKTITLNLETITLEDVTFTISDPSVASVDKSGKVTGLHKGTATLTAENLEHNLKDSLVITVEREKSEELTANMLQDYAEGYKLDGTFNRQNYSEKFNKKAFEVASSSDKYSYLGWSQGKPGEEASKEGRAKETYYFKKSVDGKDLLFEGKLGWDNKVIETEKTRKNVDTKEDEPYPFEEARFSSMFKSLKPEDFEKGEEEGSFNLKMNDESLTERGIYSMVYRQLTGETKDKDFVSFTLYTDGYTLTKLRLLISEKKLQEQSIDASFVGSGSSLVVAVESLDTPTIPELDNMFTKLKEHTFHFDFVTSDLEGKLKGHSSYEFFKKTSYTKTTYIGENLTQTKTEGGFWNAETSKYQDVIKVNEEFYANGKESTMNKYENNYASTFDVSTSFFEKKEVDGETRYLLREDLPLTLSSKSVKNTFSPEGSFSLTEDKGLYFTIKDDSLTLSYEKKNDKVVATYTAIGTATNPISEASYHSSGDSLLLADLLKAYNPVDGSAFVSKYGGEKVINLIPVLGSYYNAPSILGNYISWSADKSAIESLKTSYLEKLNNNGFTLKEGTTDTYNVDVDGETLTIKLEISSYGRFKVTILGLE